MLSFSRISFPFLAQNSFFQASRTSFLFSFPTTICFNSYVLINDDFFNLVSKTKIRRSCRQRFLIPLFSRCRSVPEGGTCCRSSWGNHFLVQLLIMVTPPSDSLFLFTYNCSDFCQRFTYNLIRCFFRKPDASCCEVDHFHLLT